jgi:hypothetical protein
MAVAGFSSGGTLAANLLSQRSDIRCAVIKSAPLDLTEFYRGRDGAVSDVAAPSRSLADPMQSVGRIRSSALIWVLGDPRDRTVPVSLWSKWAAEARRHGARVVLAYIAPASGEAPSHRDAYHRDSSLPLRIAGACAASHRADNVRHTGSTLGVAPSQATAGGPVIPLGSVSEVELGVTEVGAAPADGGSAALPSNDAAPANSPTTNAVVTGVVAAATSGANAAGVDAANPDLMGADVVITDEAGADPTRGD